MTVHVPEAQDDTLSLFDEFICNIVLNKTEFSMPIIYLPAFILVSVSKSFSPRDPKINLKYLYEYLLIFLIYWF